MANTFQDLKESHILSNTGFGKLLETTTALRVVLALSKFTQSIVFGERHGSWFKTFRWENSDPFIRLVEFSITNQSNIGDNQSHEAFVSVRIGASSNEKFYVDAIFAQPQTINSDLEELIDSQMLIAFERLDTLTVKDLDQDYYQYRSVEESKSAEEF